MTFSDEFMEGLDYADKHPIDSVIILSQELYNHTINSYIKIFEYYYSNESPLSKSLKRAHATIRKQE